MKTISIPYYTSSLELHIAEENLEALIYAKTEEYTPGKGEGELGKGIQTSEKLCGRGGL